MTHGSFFEMHRELFEFDKYVGIQQIPSLSTKTSFLDQYMECEKRQVLERAKSSTSNILLPTTAVELLFYQNEKDASPDFLNTQYKLQALHEIPFSGPYRSPQRVKSPKSPPRGSWELELEPTCTAQHYGARARGTASEQSARFKIPKLSDLLLDASSRAAYSRSKRIDDAKKIELLVGSTCVGRISAVSTNLPPAIHRRLEASSRVHQRREQLVALLSNDYDRLST